MRGLLLSVLMVVGIWLFTYLTVTAVFARKYGYRLWTRRRLKAVWQGEAECKGGPFDGTMLPVNRSAAACLVTAPWPNVAYNVYTREHSLTDGSVRYAQRADRVWSGYYRFSFLDDHYEWHGTGLEQFYITTAATA